MNTLYIPETVVSADTVGDLMNSLRGGQAAPVSDPAAPGAAVPPAAADVSPAAPKVIPKTNVAADTVGDLMNSMRGGQSEIPVFDPGAAAPVPSAEPKVIPKTNVAVDDEDARRKAALKNLRSALRSDRPMVINGDGTLSVLDSAKSRESNIKTIPKTQVAADTVGDLMNSLRGGQTAAPAPDPVAPSTAPKVIPKTNVAAQQWYQTNPSLYYAEVAAMRQELNMPALQPLFKPDGSMYWQIKCTPNLGPEFHTQEYTLELIYDYNHPHCGYGSSVKAYVIDPTMQQLQNWVARIPGLNPPSIPHLLSSGNRLYLCTSRISDTSADLEKGATSAVTSFRFAYRWLCIFEAAIRDPDGLWKDFHKHGVI